MTRPFIHPPLALAKAEAPQRPELTFQNKFTVLADYPRLPCPSTPKLPKLPCPPQPKLINIRPTKPFDQGASSSSIQTKESYAMKAPESFALTLKHLIRPCYTNSNFVDTDNSLKTKRFYEAILIDTDSIEIEHSRDENNPANIRYSRFTIKKILDPFKWFADHLHTPIALSVTHKPQTYN
ncbi:hypothetical protein H5410_040364 [Solanum commersonii]|uniref:Uncharacterized protein n=1 Tax=Solanum commersonii TaxID=4109 RepID=A0A9J5XPX9_SOLCO|nr:hypothetical protein H5410_040364 [Solanum commersonii]